MTKTSGWAKVVLVGLGCLAAAAVWRGVAAERPAQVAQAKKDEPPAKAGKEEAPAKWSGAGACIRCHTQGAFPPDDDNFVLLTEYTTWRTQDKHALAYLALAGDRGQRMGKLLGIPDVTQADACRNCHAINVPDKLRGSAFLIEDGVSCDGCHGASSQWLNDHADKSWRRLSADQKREKGMNNLRDPAVRAEVCADCHVGNADKGRVVSHAMYAAGHPPLPNLEVACFSRRLPQHWRNKRDVPFLMHPPKDAAGEIAKLYHTGSVDYQQVQLTAASSLVGLRCAMGFVAGRSRNLKAGDPPTAAEKSRWPELDLAGFADVKLAALWPQLAMAQADCYACHHELQRPVAGRPNWRQLRGYSGPPGRPQVRPWPLELAKLGFPSGGPDFAKGVHGLHLACNGTPFGDPAELAKAATVLEEWAQAQGKALNLADAKLPHREQLAKLCGLPKSAYPDYDSARQIASAIHAIYHEWAPKSEQPEEVRTVLDALERDFNLGQPVGRADRIKAMKKQFESPKRKFLTDAQAVEALEAISSQSLDKLYPAKNATEKQQALRDGLDQFLLAVRKGGENFSGTILKDEKPRAAFLKEMDTNNERELADAMSKVADYNPFIFKENLEKLAKLLPRP